MTHVYLDGENGEYEAPRKFATRIELNLVEMKRSRKTTAFCCGAGGACNSFKESETWGQEDKC